MCVGEVMTGADLIVSALITHYGLIRSVCVGSLLSKFVCNVVNI